jgi:hypothetical protein
MKPAVLLLSATCISVGFGLGMAAERFSLSSRDKELAILKELRGARETLADLQRSNGECVRTALLCAAVRSPSAADGKGAEPAALAEPSARLPKAQPSAETAPATPTAENFAAFDAGEKFISSAMARGTWTRNDRRELARLGRAMSDEQLLTLEQRVTQAVNTDKLKLDLP